MDVFEYLATASLDETLGILKERSPEVAVLAGGTDLLVQMKEGVARPRALLDIGRIPQLRGIHEHQGHLLIGPLATHWDLARSPLIREHAWALAQGACQVGSPQIRFRGTLGGNIANASPAADTVPALLALGGEVQIRSLDGSRWISVESLLEGPSKTVLLPQELITGIRIPLGDKRSRSQYRKFGTRNALSIAVASVAVAAQVAESGRLAAVRIALGSVSPMVMRASQAETILTGQILTPDLVRQASLAAAQQCCPIDDVRGSAWYRRVLVEALLAEILLPWAEGG